MGLCLRGGSGRSEVGGGGGGGEIVWNGVDELMGRFPCFT